MKIKISMYSRCNISSKIGHQYSVGKTVCALHMSRSEQNKIAIICAIRPLVNSIYIYIQWLINSNHSPRGSKYS